MVISVTAFTAARSQAIEQEAIVGGVVVGDDLILAKFNGGTINAGNVRGGTGPSGSGFILCTSSTRPSPSVGMSIYETNTNRAYIYNGTTWKWLWSSNDEANPRVQVNVGGDVDATGNDTFPPALELSVNIPPWAKKFEAFSILGQAHQVTNPSNTELTILIGSRGVGHKRIRWTTLADDNERDLFIAGEAEVDDLAGSTQLFRVKAQRVTGTGALRLDAESTCYLSGTFTD